MKNKMVSKAKSKGFDECVGVTRILLRTLGVWPGDIDKRNILNHLHTFIACLSIIIFLIIPQMRKAIIVKDDFNELLEVMSLGIIVLTVCLLKFLGIWNNQKALKELLVHISDDWKIATKEEQPVMWRNAKLSKIVVSVVLCSTFTNVTLLCLRAVLAYRSIANNLVPNETFVKPLILLSDYYYDHQISPLYEIAFVGQLVACYIACFIYTAFDGFFVFAVLHYTGQIFNLESQVECLMQKKEDECSFLDVFIPVINRHRHLLRCTHMIEQNFNKAFLAQILIMSILICLQAYQFVIYIPLICFELLYEVCFTVSYISSSLFGIFVYCFICEQLREQSERLFVAICKLKWYELPANEAKLLIIFLVGTEKPIEITVGKFSAFSLEYFCSFIPLISMELLRYACFTITHVSSSLFGIFMYCLICEQLREQSERLFIVICKINWYELPLNEAKLLIIFLIGTEKPIEITVGKFTPFSLEYFCSLLKTSVGYLSMLLAMRERF